MTSAPFAMPDSTLLRAAIDACAARPVRAWLAGGPVRDILLARPVHDFDFAVERDAIGAARATADRLAAPMYVLDAQRDTARVVAFAADGARVFLDFAGLRAPTLEADLALRDFTVDAMAVDLARPDALIDPLNGRRDLAARRIRVASDRALDDDPVRLLRAVRLSAGLGFEIEPGTRERVRASAHLVTRASAERVRDELAHIVGLPGLSGSLTVLDDLGLLGQVLPELPALRGVEQSPPHHWDVLEHTLRALDVLEILLDRLAGVESHAGAAPSVATVAESAWADVQRALGEFRPALQAHFAVTLSDDRSAWLALKWAAMYHDAGKPATRSVDADGRIRNFGHEEIGAQVVAGRMRALRFSNDEAQRAATVVRHHMRPHHLHESGLTRRAAYRFFRDAGAAGVDVLVFALADHLATHGPDLELRRWMRRLDVTRALLEEFFRRRDEAIDPPALISGHDLMEELGLGPGPRLGQLLEALREAQAAGEVRTRQEALAWAQELIGRQ